MQSYALPPWGRSIYVNYLEFSCMRYLSLLHLIFNNLFIKYRVMDIHAIVCHFVAQIVSDLATGAFSVDSHAPLKISHQ